MYSTVSKTETTPEKKVPTLPKISEHFTVMSKSSDVAFSLNVLQTIYEIERSFFAHTLCNHKLAIWNKTILR
jgi:hypothetical protein